MVGLMPMGQMIVVFGLHFHLFRVLLLVGVVRVLLREELARWNQTGNEQVVPLVGWALAAVSRLPFTALEALLINRLGDAYNAAFCYIFARSVIVDYEDAMRSIRMLAWVSIAIGLLMLWSGLRAQPD